MTHAPKPLHERLNDIEFDHPFVLHPDGTITEPVSRVHAPDVFHDDANDIEITGAGWHALTGMTCQYSYCGAVMHPSEYIGRGIADYLLGLVVDAEEPMTFVVVAVECWPEDHDPEPEPAGWAILWKEETP